MDFRYTQNQQDLIEATKKVLEGKNTLQRLRDLVGERRAENTIKQKMEMVRLISGANSLNSDCLA